MKNIDPKEYTPDGFEIVYISKWFFDMLEREMMKISRRHPNQMDNQKMVALRDEPGQIEFRRLETKKE